MVDDDAVGPVAALCTWTHLAGEAAQALEGSDVAVASVAGDFPAGLATTDVKVREIEAALAEGAHEIDTVLNRRSFLDGDDEAVYEELVSLREASGSAILKVILETGELQDLASIRRASLIALVAGADFIKSSTGKSTPGATPEAAVVMCDTIKDFYATTARAAGLKVAGGIRTAEDALLYMHIVRRVLGDAWLNPDRFRIGASSLLNDFVSRLEGS